MVEGGRKAIVEFDRGGSDIHMVFGLEGGESIRQLARWLTNYYYRNYHRPCSLDGNYSSYLEMRKLGKCCRSENGLKMYNKMMRSFFGGCR